jgi:hypothetical protein
MRPRFPIPGWMILAAYVIAVLAICKIIFWALATWHS